jgi:hypothetical protein
MRRSNPIVLEFRKLLGDQAPTTMAIERNLTNVLRVYGEILGYYKDFGEKMTLGNTEFHQRKSLKKKKMHSQKRVMRLYKQYFNCIKKQHPKLSKDEVHDVMEGIYNELCSGNTMMSWRASTMRYSLVAIV